MKKLLLLLLLAVSCTEVERTATIRLSLGVESGPMTKVSAEGVASLIAETQNPYPFSVTLTSKRNPLRTYEVRVGGEVTVAVDDYTVFGEQGGGDRIFSAHGGGRMYVYPTFYVSQDISVKEGGGVFRLDVIYNCFALVIDYSVCSSYAMKSQGGSVEDISGMYGDGIGIAYCQPGAWAVTPVPLVVSPANTATHEAKSFDIYTAGSNGVVVECGKWYSFSPGALVPTSGTFGLSTPAWVMGGQY
jgi:hypothetical protein